MYPYDPATSYLRDPGRYPHDAFGHDGADGCGRSMPHTGADISSRASTWEGKEATPVLSPVYGTIVETGMDPEAGLYHLIVQDGTGLVWGAGHHSRFTRRSGRVERGDHIAYMGATGGAKGVHTHWWVGTTLEAARHVVTGLVNLRNGRTVAEWAASMGGLLDPYPLLVAEWADEERRLAAAAAAQAAAEQAAALAALIERRKADDMHSIKNKTTGHVYMAGQQFLRHETSGAAGGRTAALLTPAGKVLELTDEHFREVLNALGIPLAAAQAVLRGKLWSPATGVVDARALEL